MFNRVPMNVIQMTRKVILVTDEVLPISRLPEFDPRVQFQIMPGQAFYLCPSQREISIAFW
jgi:hypothetical protein